MILHAASIATFFVAQTQQAQCAVQCVQAALGTWWDRLLQFLPQLIVSVIPVAGGVWIADRSFRKTKKLTEESFRATSEKDHERWVLDQKKAEWSQLLKRVAEVHRVLRVVSTTGKERAELIVESLKPAVHELIIAQSNCVFLETFFADQERSKKFFSFLYDADRISDKISGLLF